MGAYRDVLCIIFMATTLVGCATVTPLQQEKWNESIPICFGDDDCRTKWAAARDWVRENAGYKIQIYSDDFIETYSPIGSDQKIAVSVTKKPLATYAAGVTTNGIFINVRCGNVFGCVPSHDQAITAFNRYVAQTEIVDWACYANMVASGDSPKIGMYPQIFMSKKMVIKRVCSGSPAGIAGLKPNDVIQSIDSVEISSDIQLDKALQGIKFGDQLKFNVVRDGQPLSLTVKLFSKEKQEQFRAQTIKSTAQTSNQDVEKKLESLARMLEKGLINKQEFEEKKRQLLQDM